MIKEFEIMVQGHPIRITNPEKPLWPKAEISKLDFIQYLIDLAPYLLPYAKNRILTTIRYPHGIEENSFYQKNAPDYAPNWMVTHVWRGTRYILANDIQTLVWLGNQTCIEFHVPCNHYQQLHPSEIAFDLDPTDVHNFDLVLEVSLLIKDVLDALGLHSQVKTSGVSGLQIYIPIVASYSYERIHRLNKFIAHYIVEKHPKLVTVERLKKNRGRKIYFDYLQHGLGKTLPLSYSPRATKEGTVSAPVTWDEIIKGFSPRDFTIKNMKKRVEEMGDLFHVISTPPTRQSIDPLLQFIERSY